MFFSSTKDDELQLEIICGCVYFAIPLFSIHGLFIKREVHMAAYIISVNTESSLAIVVVFQIVNSVLTFSENFIYT